jgi:hypothetical protein
MQAEAPKALLYVPRVQGAHVSTLVAPRRALAVPFGHGMHELLPRVLP